MILASPFQENVKVAAKSLVADHVQDFGHSYLFSL